VSRPPEAGQGFSDVDGSADPALLVGYLDEAGRLPVLRDVDRQLAHELRLGPGSRVLDIGCGSGEDTIRLAALVVPGGRAIGLDASAVMVREARRRAAGTGLPVEFLAGRAEEIDLPPGHVDACRFERVLQHLPSPAAALREAARVLRPGGRLAAFEPDWTRFSIAGAGRELTGRIVEARLRMVANPDVGARLPGLLAGAGLGEVRAREAPLVVTALDEAVSAFWLERCAEAAVTLGAVSSSEAREWLESLDAAERSGAFRARVEAYVVSGTRRP
jgi:SAM-dependent methyltransferase